MAETQQQIAVVDDSAYDTMALMPKTMVQAQDFAKQLSESTLIPKHLQKKPGDCLMVTMQAYRWRIDPFVVANCTSVVHGRLMYEGKLIYAVLKSMNAIEGRLEFEFDESDKNNLGITVTGTPRGGKPQSLSGTVKGWRTRTFATDNQGNKTDREIPNNWDKDPYSQIVYRATRQWARVFAPEAILGVYAPEDDFDDDTPIAAVVSQPVPQKAAPAAPPVEEGSFTPTPPRDGMRPPPTPKKAAPQAAPAPAPAAPASAAAPAQDGELFDDPAPNGAAPAAPAAAAPEEDDPPHEGEPGDAITEAMGRVVESARTNAKISKARLDTKFPKGLGKSNINDALAWLRSRGQTA